MRILTKLIKRGRILLPPDKYKNRIGGVELFEQMGKATLDGFITKYGLKKSDSVLDIGCGCGRVAIPLTRYLNSNASYEGQDIDNNLIKWCKGNIMPIFPNFNFTHANVYSSVYNPNGKTLSSSYKFKFHDCTFDFVFLISVFTHMLPHDIDNYISEISRVLKKGKGCCISYFLINGNSLKSVKEKKSTPEFTNDYDIYWLNSLDDPEYAVAYDENFIRKLYKKYNLEISEPINFTNWSNGQQGAQDIIFAIKK